MSSSTRLTISIGDRQLQGLIETSDRPGPRPTVVVCHGFKGFMEWGFFPYLASLLCGRGFTTVRFNFHGNGMRPGDSLVTDIEAFRHATFSQDLSDLLALLEFATTAPECRESVDPTRLGLFGHSRGGGAALLAAAHPEWVDRIGALVTWSAVSTFDRQSDSDKLRWRQRGSFEVVNSRTGQKLEVDRSVLDDLEANRDRLDLLTAAETRQAPWLLVHGNQDETVPVDEARSLAECASGHGRLIEIPGANHTFGATHPFDGPTPALTTALNETQGWFREYL